MKRSLAIFSFIALLAVLITPAHAVLPNIFSTQPAGNVQAALLDTNYTFLESQGVQGLVTTGSSNAYVATPADAWVTGYSNYVARALVVKPNFTNTGASTVNVSGLGSGSIYKNINGTQTALASGDMVSGIPALLICDGSGFLLANPTGGSYPSLSLFTNSLASDVSLNNESNYFDGPSVAQGSSGTWFASGTVTILDTSTGSGFSFKLWDGTTLIASANISVTANIPETVSLSGYLASPAGNIRISVQGVTTTTGKIKYNESGLGKDSTISVIRVQ